MYNILFFAILIIIVIAAVLQLKKVGPRAHTQQKNFKGIVDPTDAVRKKIKLREGEEILFCIGEIEWVATGSTFVRTPAMVMKNTVVTNKRIIVPVRFFFGQTLNGIDIYYKKTDVDSLSSTKRAVNFNWLHWVEAYRIENDTLILDLQNSVFKTKFTVYSSVSSELVKVLAERVD